MRARPRYSHGPVAARPESPPASLRGFPPGVSLSEALSTPPARLRLAELPTPVERAPWADGPSAEVWIKRDDRSSELYGGGKVRKLEWVLANPPYDTQQPIVSVGGIGSHHLLALALFLRSRQRRLHALSFEQTLTDHVRMNLAVMVSCGVQFWHVRSRARLPLAWLGYHLWRRPETMGVSMDAGASSPLGCFGFVQAGLELAAQIEAGELPRPHTIYVTAGSAGTSAGLALGLSLAGVSTHLHLVSSVEPLLFNGFLYRRKLEQAWRALLHHGLEHPARRAADALQTAGVTWSIDHSQVGGGYGVPTAAALQAQALSARHDLVTEPTYTAKCLAAMRAIEQQRTGTVRPVLWWNTHAGNDLSEHVEPGWEARAPVPIPEKG